LPLGNYLTSGAGNYLAQSALKLGLCVTFDTQRGDGQLQWWHRLRVEGWQLPGMPSLPGVSELVSGLQSQTEALAQLPLTVAALNSAVQGLIEAVTITRETAASAQRVSERLEEVIEELDEPVRALRPGLERVAKVLDDPVIDTVPETLRRLTEDVVPLVHGLRDAQTRVGLVFNQAANASARLAELPGAQLFRRRVRRGGVGGGGSTAS